ncbi:MAG: hypothetical protein NXI31_15300 [bacterium]|nr:hypothetical protein [bacterium]
MARFPTLRPLAVSLLTLVVPAALVAQAGRPGFVFRDGAMVHLRVERVDELVARWDETKIGKLMQDPALVELVASVEARQKRQAKRWRQVREVALTLDLELEPWDIVSLFSSGAGLLRQPPLREWRRMEMAMRMRANRGIESAHVISCQPRFDGRWAQDFERDAAFYRAAPWFVEVPAAKIDGVPSYVFESPEIEDEHVRARLADTKRWMVHLPGTFVFGSGRPEDFGEVELSGPPAAEYAGLSYRIHASAYADMFREVGMLGDGLGIAALGNIDWRLRFEGEDILEELVLELAKESEWTGLVAAFGQATAPLPKQALPKGAMAQLRLAVDPARLFATVIEFAGEELALPSDVSESLQEALDGGVAIGVAAPAAGSLIPRIYVTLGVAGADSSAALFGALEAAGLRFKTTKWGEVEVRTLDLPGLPPGIRPALGIVDGQLHVAESARSLRSFLKLQGQGIEAMDVGEAVMPAGAGDLVERFDLRCDPLELYRAFHTHWLLLLAATIGRAGQGFSRDSMPDVDVVEDFVGPMRAALRRDGDRLVLRHHAPLGGPMLTAYLVFAPVTLAQDVGDGATMVLASAIARRRLQVVADAFEAFEEREGRRPTDLVELFVAQELPADALSIPGDDSPDTLTLPGGKQIRSSFRYFRELATVDGQGRMILIEINPASWQRYCLDANLEVVTLYGERHAQPIERFGR